MRKFFYRLAAAAGVMLCLGAIAFGYLAFVGTGLDRESKAFVDEAVVDIAGHWDKDAFIRRASPQLLQTIKPDDLESFFVFYGSLGPLLDYQGSKGSSTRPTLIGDGSKISASYVARAKFKEGDADIQISAIKIGNAWKLQGFRVDSPVLVTKAVGKKT